VPDQLTILLQSRQNKSSRIHLDELLSYVASLKDAPPADLKLWAENILIYGSNILDSGSTDIQRVLLELGWEPVFTEFIKSSGIQDDWFNLEMKLIQALNYTPGYLFQRRAGQLNNKTLFRFKNGREWQNLSWSATKTTVDHLAAGLLGLLGGTQSRIAIISENRPEVAYTDIMCLSYGFLNVPIQPAAPPAQVEYILIHAEIEIIFVSDSTQLKMVENLQVRLPKLKLIITYNDVVSSNPKVHGFRKLLVAPDLEETIQWLEGVRLSVQLDDIASIMYTSGTTGYPKGIVFTYSNIISKRFARSLAFNLGREDTFLCFLPLFHTFGRFLELWGSIFWGAQYTFSSGKGIQSLLEDLQSIRPTVLISIPKRWQDIYETVGKRIDLLNESFENIHPVMNEVTGGKLRWGLSAAGYLPPEVFRFFQTHELQLHSGYGMTEATGGITMTPTGQYMENSVGSPLPGMEIKLVEDGELWIRGAYVSQEYWKPETPESRPDRWLKTGDIFQVLGSGQLEIIDRKKEIYKNANGQTVAPQKIENMFRDFDSIFQLFIVGDHMAYNTALVRVNRKNADIKSLRSEKQSLRDYVGTVINSVNSFLAPFERIINFRLVDRDFDKDHGELTEKGTFKRTVILENYKDFIAALYETPYKSYLLGELEVQIPNWVFLQRGWTRNDLEVEGSTLRHRNGRYSLVIRRQGDDLQVGSFNYKFDESVLQFDDFIRQPAYCIGNQDLEAFLDYPNLRIKAISVPPNWLPGAWTSSPLESEELVQFQIDIQRALENGDNSLEALQPIIKIIYAERLAPDQDSYRLLSRIYANSGDDLRNILRYAFLRLIRSDDLHQSRFAVEQVVALFPAKELEGLVYYALAQKELFSIGSGAATWTNINIHKVNLATNFLKWLIKEHAGETEPSTLIKNILGILYSWSKYHPEFYASIRSTLISAIVNLPKMHHTRPLILKAYAGVTKDFSTTMINAAEAVVGPTMEGDTDWDSLLLFDEGIDKSHQTRIYNAFSKTTFLAESIYLFFEGAQVPIQSIPPQGIYINLLGSAHGKAVYRATIQEQERSYKFAINLNESLSADQVETELFWLLACGRDARYAQLVETVGSYQKKCDLWSEEFISGLTVRQYLQRSVWAGVSEELPAPDYIWPHFVWTGVYTYTSFWKRTRFKKMIKVPSPGKIIIPVHDYYTGGRLISISDIQDSSNSLAFLENLEQSLVRSTEAAFPDFSLVAKTDIIYQAIREALGKKHSPGFFEEVLNDANISPQRKADLETFLVGAKTTGYQPQSVYFAIRRYHRWISLNGEATLDAKAHFLTGLYRDYHIANTESEYPDVRVQLFTQTVFSNSNPEIVEYLAGLAVNLRQDVLDARSLQTEISQYITQWEPDDFHAFFLKRLAFPELPPSEDIDLIATRSTALDDVEVMISRHDKKGGAYRIRKALHPKEIIQLERLFRKAELEVQFTQDHSYLVALNGKEQVIGGLFYVDQGRESVYMDKVVVADAYRGTGISQGILDEFFNRMRNASYQTVITGFLHPGYFYKFGFKIEKDQGGLVKYL